MQQTNLGELFATPNKVTDYTCNGKCSRCGECCTSVLLMNKSEIEQIRIYIKKHNIKAQNHIGLSVKTVDAMCPFLKTGEGKETVCTIYPVRPQICRKWKCNSAKMEMKYTNETRVNTRKEFFGDGKCFDIEIASMLKILGMDKY